MLLLLGWQHVSAVGATRLLLVCNKTGNDKAWQQPGGSPSVKLVTPCVDSVSVVSPASLCLCTSSVSVLADTWQSSPLAPLSR